MGGRSAHDHSLACRRRGEEGGEGGVKTAKYID